MMVMYFDRSPAYEKCNHAPIVYSIICQNVNSEGKKPIKCVMAI